MSAAHQRLASVAAHLGGAQVRSHAAAAGPALAPTIKALVFDVFGTVVDWRGSVAREIAAVAARHGWGGTDANAFAMRWRALYGPSMQTHLESGDFVKLDGLHRMSLDTVLAEHGWDLPEQARADLNLAWHRLDGWADTREGLARLRKQRTVATLSNGNISLMVDNARRGGWAWDAILGAEVARHYKPDPEVCLGLGRIVALYSHPSTSYHIR